MQDPNAVNPQPAMDVTDDDRLWAALSWFFSPIVPLIVLLLEDKKSRPFIKYHAVQALIFSVVGYIVSSVLSFILIGCFVGLATFGFIIYMTVKSYQGEWSTVPVITDFCKAQGWIQ